jgi:hypothetical protein
LTGATSLRIRFGIPTVENVTVMTIVPFPTEFSTNDDVRLLDRHGNVPSGALGRILGKFMRPTDPTYLVRFGDEDVAVVEIRFEEIVLVDDLRRSA